MTPRTRPKNLLRAILTKRADREALVQAEIDWPDSRGLLERLAAALRARHAADDILYARIATITAGGLAAHRAARKAQVPDRERFAAFVQGIANVLDPSEQPLLADAMTAAQRRILGARLTAVPSGLPLPPEAADA
jgi:hypothetical protein